MSSRGSGQVVPAGKVPEQDCSYQEMSSRDSGQGSPPERLQNKIVITRKCLSEALARESPQERLQNKIVITRKCLPRALAKGSPMPFRGFGQGVPRKGSRTRLLLPGNAFLRLWPGGHPRKGFQNKIVITRKCFQRSSFTGGNVYHNQRAVLSMLGSFLPLALIRERASWTFRSKFSTQCLSCANNDEAGGEASCGLTALWGGAFPPLWIKGRGAPPLRDRLFAAPKLWENTISTSHDLHNHELFLAPSESFWLPLGSSWTPPGSTCLPPWLGNRMILTG